MSEGLLLAGRFRLVSKLGQGGMGSVWRAEDLTLNSQVAVKLMDPSIAQSSEMLARFKREAQSAASLRSVHVVQILDYGVDNAVPFIAMELLEGENLASRLERLGPLTLRETVPILTQVATALTRAHQQGIVHRDLKPDNIFLVKDGNAEVAKVLDFGIAKKLGDLSALSGVKTGTGAMLGSPYYMSPEQALGQTNIDHRTDIWSFGIIAFECVTGVRPFENDTLGKLIMAICKDPLPVPSQFVSVPPEFDAWFACVAARDPDKRFSSLSNAMAALRVVSGSVSGRPPRLDHYPSPRVSEPPIAESPTHGAVPSSAGPSGQPLAISRMALIAGAAALFVIAVTLFVTHLMSGNRGTGAGDSAIASSILPVPAETPNAAATIGTSSAGATPLVDVAPSAPKAIASASASSLPTPARQSAVKATITARTISSNAPLPKKPLDKLDELHAGKVTNKTR